MVRRTQQLSTALFGEECASRDLTAAQCDYRLLFRDFYGDAGLVVGNALVFGKQRPWALGLLMGRQGKAE